MNCELIFYLSTKTGLCEKALRSSVSGLGLALNKTGFATSPEKLGKLITAAFERNDAVFIVGGLTGDTNGVENILSKALANKAPDDLKKLKNPLSSADGYLVRQGGQLLIALPDEPEEIEAVFGGPLRAYILGFNRD